ncbi:hypothetical protein FF1_005154 [Malus domestica]
MMSFWSSYLKKIIVLLPLSVCNSRTYNLICSQAMAAPAPPQPRLDSPHSHSFELSGGLRVGTTSVP